MNQLMRVLSGCLIWLFCLPATFAMEWQQLDAMRLAMQQMNYRGEFLHRRGDETSVFSIVHQFDGEQSTELLRQLDGDMVEVLRQGDQVTCYFPAGSESAMSHAVPAAPFSQVDALDLTQISANYSAQLVGQARVAGYQTKIIELAGDAWRYRQRLWLEQDTHLLLQSEIIDADGQVLEQFRFTRLELGLTIVTSELMPTLQADSTALQQTGPRKQGVQTLETQGFNSALSWLPEGYQLTFAEQTSDSQGWAEQRTYSDGLTSFTLFTDNKHQASAKGSAIAKMGATTALMTSNNNIAITVVGEIPQKTAQQISQKLLIQRSTL